MMNPLPIDRRDGSLTDLVTITTEEKQGTGNHHQTVRRGKTQGTENLPTRDTFAGHEPHTVDQ